MNPSFYKRPLLWVLLTVLAGLACFYQPSPSKQDIFHAVSTGEVTVVGQVASFAISKKVQEQVWVNVRSVDGRPAAGRVFARFTHFTPQWKDTIRFSGRLRVPYRVRLPGNFDWRDYLARKKTFVEITSSQAAVQQKAAWPWRMIRNIRRNILDTLSRSFPPQIAAVMGGVMLGERGELSPDLYTAFQDSGAIHLLVASGGNVGFVTLLTLAAGMFVGLRRRSLLLAALVTAGMYTLVAGADAPLLRAYLMAVGACVGYLLGRNSGVLHGLLLACLVIVCISPQAVLDTGFQMSFLATAAIIICLNNFQGLIKGPAWIRFFIQIFLATLAAQLALVPIFTNVFYKVSVTGLLSNMLLVPLASGLMGLGFAYYLFSLCGIGIVLYYPCLWGFSLFEECVRFFASFNFSALPVAAWNGGTIAAYYIFLFGLSQIPHKTFFRRLVVPCLGIAALCWCGGWWWENRPQVFLVSEWNNQAAVVRVQKGTVLVFNDGIQENKLTRMLYALGVRQADWAASFTSDQKPFSRARKTQTAFSGIWPGDEIQTPNYRVRAVWEKRLSKSGRLWENIGYSGRKQDGLSYCVSVRKRELCVGAHARFVQLPDGSIIHTVPNDTVQTVW